MPRAPNRKGSCTVCSHPERARIETSRGAGVALDALAERFGVSYSALQRHWTAHVTPETKAAYSIGPTTLDQARERAAKEGGSVVEHIGVLRSILFRQLFAANDANAPHSTASIAGKLLDVLRELGKISGEILRDTAPATSVTVNIGAAPGFRELMDGLLFIARQHPEARADIIALVDRLSGAPTPRLLPAIDGEARHVA